MEGEHLDAVALPRDGLAAALDLEAHQVGDRSGWTVLAGDPFGVEQSHGTRFGRHSHLDVKQAAWSVRGIDFELHRSLAVKRHT
jgi:hypothetical protein